MDRPSIGAEIACRRQDDRRSSDSAIRRDLAHTPVVSVQSVIVHEVFIRSAGRNLIDASHLMVDRDTSFIAMRDFFGQNTGTEVVLLPPKSPNLNAYMERWFRRLKTECLDRMVFFGRKSLENAVREYVEHYHTEQNHQGLDNELSEPSEDAASCYGRIECRERLGGMLKFYHRRAA